MSTTTSEQSLNKEQKISHEIETFEKMLTESLNQILAPLKEIESLEKQIKAKEHLQLSPGFEMYLKHLRAADQARSDMDDAHAASVLVHNKEALRSNNILKMDIGHQIDQLKHYMDRIWSLESELKKADEDFMGGFSDRYAKALTKKFILSPKKD